MDVKITLFFESLQQAPKYASAAIGWTETFYGSSGSIGSLDAWLVSDQFGTFLSYRRGALSSLYRIAWVRVSDMANPRSYKVKALQSVFGTAKEVTTSGLTGNAFAQVQCALLVDLVHLPDTGADKTHHRRYLMRGLPLDVINGNIVNTVTATGNFRRISGYLNWLARRETGEAVLPFPSGVTLNNSIGLLYQDPLSATYLPSPAIQRDPANKRRLLVDGFLVGTPLVSYFDLSGFPDEARVINKRWRLLSATAGTPGQSVLGKATRDLPELSVAAGQGKIRRVFPKFNLFDQWTMIGLRSKKTGRLFRQLRGRSRSR